MEVIKQPIVKTNGPGDAFVRPSKAVSVTICQPFYQVRIAYTASGGPLDGALGVWVRVGHSGWKNTQDVALARRLIPGDDAAQVWEATIEIPASQLPVGTHLDLQMAFKGNLTSREELTSREAWDNNCSSNFSVGVELLPGEGLVTGSATSQSQACISSLLLRLDHLSAQRLLTPEQVNMLRVLTWTRDFPLLKMYEENRHVPNSELAGILGGRCGFLRRPGLHVVHIAAEFAPLAKVGGLADVVQSLARAHQAMGLMVEVILPKYNCIDYKSVIDLKVLTEISVPWAGYPIRTLVWTGVAEGLPVFFLEPHSKERLFWRGTIYGEPDDVSRFVFFSKAALAFLEWSNKRPDVLHVHDWQTAAVPAMLHELYRNGRDGPLSRTGSILTIHNLLFQGLEGPEVLDKIGFVRDAVYHPTQFQDERHKNKEGVWDVNMLKGGIVYADRVTTVSPRYANEVLTPDFGCGLQSLLAQSAKAGKFSGILNGIDSAFWDPRLDVYIAPNNFSSEENECTTGKLACKKALLAQLGLPFTDKNHPSGQPLLAVVSRLTEQKGLPLILHALELAMKSGAQVVVLGSAPDPEVNRQFEEMRDTLAKSDMGRIVLRFDEALSHQIYAGADMILIPSAFEPCGLTQLISLRYGTVPVVRETGGLADTVQDVFHSKLPEDTRNGYVFQGSDNKDVATALSRALEAYQTSWPWWSKVLVPRCMGQYWGWGKSGQAYLDLYVSLVRKYA